MKKALDGCEQLADMNNSLKGEQNKWQKIQIKPETSNVIHYY